MDAAAFMRRLRAEFPELASELDDEVWRGLLHLETGVLARHTQEAIDAGDRAEARRCFAFAEAAAAGGDDAVCNAIGVSFLEHLNLTDGRVTRRWVRQELPPRLAADLRSLS